MVDDVNQLFGEQTRVDRVTDKSRTRHTKIDLQMAAVVPRNRATTRLRLKPQLGQRIAQTVSIGAHIAPACRFDTTRSLNRDNLGVAVIPRCVIHERRNRQRGSHHLAKHGHVLHNIQRYAA